MIDQGGVLFATAAGDEATRAIARLRLDDVLAAARSHDIEGALARLFQGLAEVKARATPETWARVVAAARAHPLRGLLHLDPFTLRCYARPRGHAADATALDYALRPRELAAPLSDPVAALHQCMIRGQTARALRYRRDALARAIEDTAARCARPPRILAAGSGHLRECDALVGFGARPIGRILAFDSDPDALEQVLREYPGLPVETYLGSVRDLMRGGGPFGDMDLVYCSGLMESLPQAAAAGLARALFGMLRPGGSLVVTQVLDGLVEAAFLETYMDWRLACRSPSDAVALVRDLLADSVSGWSYGESPESTVCVLTLQRR